MSSSKIPYFDSPDMSFNSSLNEGYDTADENNTRYYSSIESTDSTITESSVAGINVNCSIEVGDISQCSVFQSKDGEGNENISKNMCKHEPALSQTDANTQSQMKDVIEDSNILAKIIKDPVSNESDKYGTPKELQEETCQIKIGIDQMDKVENNIKVHASHVHDDKNPIDTNDNIKNDSLLGDATGEIYDTPEGKVLLYKMEGSEELFAVPVDSEQYSTLTSSDETPNSQSQSEELQTASPKPDIALTSKIDKGLEDSENFVEEYLDEEYLEYETVEGEPVTGDSYPNTTIITPSDSDDDASDNSPVMAYLEKNENLNFFKNNPDAVGIPAVKPHLQTTEKNSEKKKILINDQIIPLKNGLTSALLSADLPIIKYKKINTNDKSSTEPKYAIMKKATLYNNVPKIRKLKYRNTDNEPANIVVMNVEIDEVDNSNNENVPVVKKPRERKQVLEPANVEVVFELEKVDSEETVRKTKKKNSSKNTKLDSSTGKTDGSDSKAKRKWVRKKVQPKVTESPSTPKRQSKRLSTKKLKKKTCAIASCKCDLDHEHNSNNEESESELHEYENTSDYSDEWQLSPRSVAPQTSSPPKVKVYSNIRKRQHSHKSTFDEDEDEISNDLLTLIKKDEKSNKEIDLNKEFPETAGRSATPIEQTASFGPDKETDHVKEEHEQNIIKSSDLVINKATRSEDNDLASILNMDMLLINVDDVEEFEGFETSKLLKYKVKTKISPESVLNNKLMDKRISSEQINIEEEKKIVKHTPQKQLLKPKLMNKSKQHVCTICKRMFKLEIHLELHKKMHVPSKVVACRYCSKTFSHTRLLKEHAKICSSIKDNNRNKYLEELNKIGIKLASKLKSKEVSVKLNTPRKTKHIMKTPLKSYTNRALQLNRSGSKASKLIMKSKIVKSPLEKVTRSTFNTSSQNKLTEIAKSRMTAIRHSTMQRRSQISKTINNKDVPPVPSKPSISQMYKCENCELSFKTSMGLQKHKSTHKNVQYKCAKCSKHFLSHSLLSKHGLSCAETPTAKSRRTMQVSTLTQILSSAKSNKSVPLRKRPAHTGVPLSNKMQKALDNIKKDLRTDKSTS